MNFDIIIVGGGLSGLALAAELAHPAFSQLRILVLEQRQHYLRDRTWSYWRAATDLHRYSHLERYLWRNWRVQQPPHGHDDKPKIITKHGTSQQYYSLDGDQFYAAAQQAIARSTHVTLRLGAGVRRIIGGDTPSVETVDGTVLQADWVFDARPPGRLDSHRLVQQFVGAEIETSTAVFDPATVELMQFQPNPTGLHFFYILPYSSTNALVETTWISPAGFQPDFEAELNQFITRTIGPIPYDVVYRERGSLNLDGGDPPLDHLQHVVALGRRAGTLRASTGYAFLETLQHAEKIAASLKRHLGSATLKEWIPTEFQRNALDKLMDEIFLKVLQRDWASSSQYFMSLFEKLDADSMVAFLNGTASWRQRLSVLRALPTRPFAAQALSTLIHRSSTFSGNSTDV